MFSVWISEQTAIISLYNINWLDLVAFAKLRKASMSFISVRLPVCPHGTTRLPLDGFSRNFIFEYLNLSRKFKFHQNRTKTTGTSREDQHIFIIASHSVLLRLGNVSDKICRKNQTTNFTFSNIFRKSYRV